MNGFAVTKCMTTETAHRLCNYVGKCAHIHGHSYRWEVTMARIDGGISPENGIAIDFAELKGAMKECIYDRFDHALVLWKEDPLKESLADAEIHFASDGADQKIVWMEDNPTAEVFAKHAAEELRKLFFGGSDAGAEIEVLSVKVWETTDSYGQWSKGGRFATGRNVQNKLG